jgi:two-component system LytT family response regulator
LVENEEHSLARLRRTLERFTGDLEVVGEATDGPSAVTTIEESNPDLVFLDIDLPGLNGFQVLGALERQPIVIFTTAFNQHALSAFKTHAVAYLLKPIAEEDVRAALEKLRLMSFDGAEVTRALRELSLLPGAKRFLTRLSCKQGERTFLVKVGEVLYFQADNKYTCVVTTSREYLIDTPVAVLEKSLDPQEFVRIHRATLVNVNWIAEIRRAYTGKTVVVLNDQNGRELQVSRSYTDNLKDLQR